MNKSKLINALRLIIIILIVIILFIILIFLLKVKKGCEQNAQILNNSDYLNNSIDEESDLSDSKEKNLSNENQSISEEFYDSQEEEEKEKEKLTLETLNNFLQSKMEVEIIEIFFDEKTKNWIFEIKDEKYHLDKVADPHMIYGKGFEISSFIPFFGGRYGNPRRKTNIQDDLLIFKDNINYSQKKKITKFMSQILKNESLSNEEMIDLCDTLNLSLPEKILLLESIENLNQSTQRSHSINSESSSYYSAEEEPNTQFNHSNFEDLQENINRINNNNIDQ
jgi:hypothetical protein